MRQLSWRSVRILTVLFGLGLLAFSKAGWAQQTTHSSRGYGFLRQQGDRLADKNNRPDWPRVSEGETGTQVHLTFDFRNADITLITNHEFPLQRLQPQAAQIARALHFPSADYITFVGTQTTTVDIELNKYLHKPDRRHTDLMMDLAALRQALEASQLPRPIVMLINPEDAEKAVLRTPGVIHPLAADTFYALDQVPAQSTLYWTATISPYAYPVITVFAVLFLSALAVPLVMPWRALQKRAETSPEAIPDPAKVQAFYNKQKPRWLTTLIAPGFIVFLSLFGRLGSLGHFLSSVFAALPPLPDSRVLLIAPVLFLGLMAGSQFLAGRVQRKRNKSAMTLVETTATAPQQRVYQSVIWVLPLIVGMALMPSLLFLPAFSALPSENRLLILFGIECLVFVGAALLGLQQFRKGRRTLKTEDPWFQEVERISLQAGVNIKQVVIVRSSVINAYASIFGTVGLTEALLQKMTTEEVRAVIAHEIGHFKAGHVRRGLAISLATLVLVLPLRWYGLILLRGHLSDLAYELLSGPLVSVILLPMLLNLLLGRGRREREVEADRFAVEITGDAALVIQALTKLHTLNATPHQLKRSDEAFSTHPSLEHRIAAIHQRFPTKAASSQD